MTAEPDLAQRIARLEQARAAPPRRTDHAAVIAALIGLLALVVSGYTAYLQRRQLRAQVWPHLQLEYSSVHANFMVINQGTGPARVTGMRVTCGGAVIHGWDDAIRLAGFTGSESVIRTWFHEAVVPADQTVTLLEAAADDASRARFAELFPHHPHEIAITVCYCSVLDECWVASTGEPARAADRCPIPEAERFRE